LIDRLIPKFALVYGPSISHPSLRRAIVLHCGSSLPEVSSFDTIAERRRLARQALGRRLKQIDVLDEGDLFAAFFVAYHFYFSHDCENQERLTYAKGFFAVARRLFGDDNRSINSTFGIFWRMLIWEISGWSRLDAATLIPHSTLDLVPSHHGQWCRALDQPLQSVNEEQGAVVVSVSLFLTLKVLYKKARTLEENYFRRVKDIEAQLSKVGELYVYNCFDSYIAEGWKVYPPVTRGWFRDAFHYSWCCLLLSVLPPASNKLNFAIVAETRVFRFFSRIEHSVDRLEASLVNQHDVLSLPGSQGTQETDDPLLYEGKVAFHALY